MQKSYNFLIVEDELLIAETISDILKSAGHTNICMVDSVEDAIKEIENNKPDLILTDIALGKEKTGLDLGALIHSRYHIPFVYITSHSSPEILGRAKHTRPNAYIIKPFKNEDLLVAIEFALFNSDTDDGTDEADHLVVKEGRAIVKLPYPDIKWLEADGNYTTIIMGNGRRRVVRTAISEFETQLSKKIFIRIHKSYIVNYAYVSEVKTSLLMIDEQELPIGRTYQANVASYFNVK